MMQEYCAASKIEHAVNNFNIAKYHNLVSLIVVINERETISVPDYVQHKFICTYRPILPNYISPKSLILSNLSLNHVIILINFKIDIS